MNEELKSVFLEGAMDNLNELEEALLKLNSEADNHDEIDRVFRAMHTIKGSAAMVGIDTVAEFAHKLETELQHVRAGEAPVTKALIDCTLAARDQILAMIEEFFDGTKADSSRCEEILSGIRKETQDCAGLSQKKSTLMNDCLTALAISMESWTESQPVTATMSRPWTEALEVVKSCKMECITEFLTGFESFFSRLSMKETPLPAGALQIGKKAAAEALKMLADADEEKDPATLDPLEVVASLQNAMNLRAEIERLSTASASGMRAAGEQQFRIRIYGAKDAHQDELEEVLLGKLREQGSCSILNILHHPVLTTKQEQLTA